VVALAKEFTLSQDKLTAAVRQRYRVHPQTQRNLLPIEVTFEAVGDNLPIEDNKNIVTGQWMPGKGKKIYPGWKVPDEDVDRNYVHVKVNIGIQGMDVHLKAFDVDDPTDDLIIDDNDAHTGANFSKGDDNHGADLDGFGGVVPPTFKSNGQQTLTLTSDSEGIARLPNGELPQLKVDMGAGDNVRVAVCIDDITELDGLNVIDDPTNNGDGYIDGDSDQQPKGFNGVVSPLLTTWRKLHIEVDSMGAVPTDEADDEKNYESGTITGVTQNNAIVTLTLSDNLTDTGRYLETGAQIEISGYDPMQVLDVPSSNTVRVIASGDPASPDDITGATSSAYKIYDDDYEIISLPLHGRSGEIITNMRKDYAPAYIEIVEANNPNPTVEFKLHEPAASIFEVVWNDSKDADTDPEFWHQLVTLGYQPQTDRDGDDIIGDNSQILLGGTPEGGFVNNDYCVVYTETIRDSDKMNAVRSNDQSTQNDFIAWISLIASHEVGHVPGIKSEGGEHGELGIMVEGAPDDLGAEFTSETIKRFRQTNDWD